jgi:iron complex outermembrane recepter protein
MKQYKNRSLVSTHVRAALISSGAIIGLCTSVPAIAQLEEVLVTAQKRQESVQDISLAVTAVADERLVDGLIADPSDLQALIPNLSVGADFGQAKIFIRGIGLNSSFAGVDPSVALHLDGAVISQSYAQLGVFFDLDRVEVLRGPQGTLYGRNATGGSVNLISKKPTDEFEGYATATIGNYSKLDVAGAVSGAISDRVQGRFAFSSKTHEGYGSNPVSNNDIDDENRQAFRAMLNFDINEDMSLLVSGDYATENDNSGQMHFIDTYRDDNLRQLGINDENNLPPGVSIDGNIVTLADGSVEVVTRPAPGVGGYADDERNVPSEIMPKNEKESSALTATFDWVMTDNWALKSITNFRDLEVLYQQDIDQSSNVNDDIQKNTVESEQFSEELQFIYNGEKLRGLVGLYYFSEELVNDGNDIAFAMDNPDTDRNERDFVYLFGDIDIEALGLFANFTYNFTDNLALKAGVRYSDETREGDNFFRVNGNKFACSPDVTTAANGNCQDKESFTDTSPTIGLDWNIGEDVLLYASYSEGFKSGAISGGSRTPITDPETIESWELGSKGTWLDSTLRINVAAFYYEIEDLQQSRSAPSADGTFLNIFENAASAEGKGVEVEVNWLLTEQFRIDGYVAVLDTEFTEFDTNNPLYPSPVLEDLSGNVMKQSPELSWNIHGQYDLPLSNGGNLGFGAEVSYKDEQYFTEFNDEVDREDDYTLVNANIKYTSPDERFFVNVWGKNLGDETVYTGRFVIGSVVTIGGTLLPPRTYGATIGYSF